jgi:hypothetical protein
MVLKELELFFVLLLPVTWVRRKVPGSLILCMDTVAML